MFLRRRNNFEEKKEEIKLYADYDYNNHLGKNPIEKDKKKYIIIKIKDKELMNIFLDQLTPGYELIKENNNYYTDYSSLEDSEEEY